MKGRVFQRGARWCYVLDVAPPGTERRQEQRTYDTEAEAQAALAARNVELERGGSSSGGRATVSAYLRNWLRTLRVSSSTKRVYQLRIETWVIPYLGKQRLDRVRPRDVKTWHEAMVGAGLALSTIREIHSTLRKALNDAVALEEIPRNVAALVRPPAVPRKEAEHWTIAQAMTFVAGVAGHEWSTPYVLMLGTGIRAGECLALTWDDLDLVGGWLWVRRTMTVGASGKRTIGTEAKSDAGRRRIRLDSGTVDELRRHRDRQAFRGGGDLVFPGDVPGMPLTGPTLRRRFDILCRMVGLEGTITPHGLRHTHATLLLARGVDAKTVSERLGHASVSFTLDTYGHVLEEQQETATDAIEQTLRG